MQEPKQLLIEAITNLTFAEDNIESILDKQDEYNNRENDLIHYIENNSLSTSGCYSIVKELKYVLNERRKIKQLWDINKTYVDNKGKLNSRENRQMLIAEINKKERLLPIEYINRFYTDEQLKHLARKKEEEIEN